MVKNKIKNFIENYHNDENDITEIFSDLIDGRFSNLETKKLLLEINKTPFNEKLLFILAKLLNERSIKINIPEEKIVDVCGTGGDGLNTLNISTAVAFVLAAYGLKIVKHGNKKISSLSGSADIFNSLGFNINQTQDEIKESLEKYNLAFIYAPNFHPCLKNVSQARSEIKNKTIFNFLGPLINPAQTKYQLIGCSDYNLLLPMIKTCLKLGKKRCWIVNGNDKMDEISITTSSTILKLENQIIKETSFNPSDYNIPLYDLSDIAGKDPIYNTEKMIELFSGKKDNKKLLAYYNIVSINAAAVLMMLRKVDSFPEGIRVINEIIDSKKILDRLNNKTTNP